MALGVAGSLLLGIGLVLWALAALRALQNETGTMFNDHLSWLPYLITLVLCGIVAFLSFHAIKAEKRKAEKRKAARDAREAATS